MDAATSSDTDSLLAPPRERQASTAVDRAQPRVVDALTLDEQQRDVAAELAERLEGRTSRMVLHVHTQMPADRAGRTIFNLVADRVQRVPGLVSTKWQVTDGRRAAHTGLLTVTISMPVHLSAYAPMVVDDHQAQVLDLEEAGGAPVGQVLDLTLLWPDEGPVDIEDQALVAAAHAVALEHTTRIVSPALVDPRITAWHLTGTIES